MPPYRAAGNFADQEKSFMGATAAGRGGFSKGKQSYRGGHTGTSGDARKDNGTAPTEQEDRFEEVERQDRIDERLGFYRYREGPEKLGWLINMRSTLVKHHDWPSGRAAVDYYFIEQDGGSFKSTIISEPYFFVACKKGTESDVEEYVRRKFDKLISKVERVQKDDLSMPNHLLGYKRTFLQLFFRNVPDLLSVRKVLLPAALKNKKNLDALDAYAEVVSETTFVNYEDATIIKKNINSALDNIVDIREYDVPYHLRVAIDYDIRVGIWYNVRASSGEITLTKRPELVKRADPVVMAFDIETTKLPLKFPDAAFDNIMMISYMIDGDGFLIVNRDICSADIADFEYTPKPEYEGIFTVFNEKDEKALLRRFMEHIQEVRPTVFVTYNGDFFDWPFVEGRCIVHNINMMEEIGFSKDAQDEYKSATGIHMDAFRWVKRDSYLPQGSQGLKAVTTAKLGYNPTELDPEVMTRYASEQPQTLAQYSVSDAVATYYLYMKYVHPFVFSLCNIIPLSPDEVLRKGTGTLCEMLLMVGGVNIRSIAICAMTDKREGKMFDGHLLESETYVGGHVEALEAGVFRSDIPYHFKVDSTACQELIDSVDDALGFCIVNEGKLSKSDVVNYDDVRGEIVGMLENLRDNNMRNETPLIYHLDVAAMYPNIMLTNRLQPDSIISEEMCAACDFNFPDKTCDRRMTWSWRGQYYPAKRAEYNMIRNQLETETFSSKTPGGPRKPWISLTPAEQNSVIASRLGEYSRRVYRKTHETKVVEREDVVCQRENPFYIDTVRSFRDRRYEYKGLHKTWKKKADEATEAGDAAAIDEAKKMIVLYDSLQLAHKCILNSFYGYVMRKGSRWYSMEMAGIVCLTGAKIIQMARELVERLGRPLELDTDGIWCILPSSFPENFAFKLANGKKFPVSYPCTILNHLVHGKFTNHQYADLVNPDTYEYATHPENSIYFEVDGPYRAMILPSSKEEDKLLKKRYAVFNDDGSLAELKGFEVKRRGELKLIKIFQSQIFKVFLHGSSLQECYEAVAKVADQWLDLLYSHGANLDDEELFELISENRSMSRALEDYGTQKSTSISTAKRLAEFLGDQMVKDKGLACKFIISHKPIGAPVTERAVPIAIFSAEPSVKRFYLRKWLKDNSLTTFDIRDLLDWEYYIDRLGSVIQKIITIPAAMQKVSNPVPRIRHPDWLFKRVAAKDDKFKQHRITDMFQKLAPGELPSTAAGREVTDMDTSLMEQMGGNPVADMEDIGQGSSSQAIAATSQKVAVASRKKTKGKGKENLEAPPLTDADLPENMPDMYTDYSSWLTYQKRKWKRQHVERSRKRQLYGDRPAPTTRAPTSNPAGGVSNYFRRQTEALASKHWEVLQIDPSETPGEFRMWVVLDRQLHPVRLTVPRTFYVNLREEQPPHYIDDAVFVQKVARQLPRGHALRHLYECQMPEATYRENVKTLSGFFRHRDVAGVYKTQIPLLIRALLDLGCVCRVANETKGTLRKSLDEGFGITDLKSEGLSKGRTYMDSSKGVHYIYLHHASTDDRHLMSLFSTATGRVTVAVASKGQNADQMPNLGRLYADRRELLSQQTPTEDERSFTYPATLDFTVEHVVLEKDAARIIQKAFSDYHDERRGPTVLIVNSQKSVSNLAMSMRAINDFPRICMPSHKRDNAFPSLDWQRHAGKRMIAHFLNLSSWMASRLALARYSNVPVCNIEADAPLFLADIFYARRLKSQNCLLWWSPTSKSDLGGKEEDENQDYVSELSNPEINNPGSYGNVCLEMDVMNLAVNTLLASTHVNELEGSTGGIGFEATAHSLDEHMNGTAKNNGNQPLATFGVIGDGDPGGSAVAFGLLKGMVRGWVGECADTGNVHAATMVEHFYRWLTSTASNMHDPVIHGIIHGLMKKVYMQLVAEFKRLGSQIVFASFNKIIILTSKASIHNARAYGRYILGAICKKPLYQLLELTEVNYWEQLLWMDCANNGGVVATNTEETSMPPSQVAKRKIEMQWNIKDYLPIATHQSFQLIIAEFIHEMHKNRRAAGPPRGIPRNDTVSQVVAGEDETKFCQRLTGQVLTRKLFRIVREMDNAQSGVNGMTDEIRAAFKFPELPGSHLVMTNPVLEFVKCASAVLALEKRAEYEIRILKRNLLDLIGVREFSDEALFRNPCESFRLYRVICTYCNFCRDLDFCRDPDLMPVLATHTSNVGDPGGTTAVTTTTTTTTTSTSTARPWLCRSCKTEYDRSAIEELLVGEVTKYLLSYQLQDLKCQKCRLVKQGNLANHCMCSGTFATMLSKEEFRKRLKVFGNIARYHHLKFLQEAVAWVVACSDLGG